MDFTLYAVESPFDRAALHAFLADNPLVYHDPEPYFTEYYRPDVRYIVAESVDSLEEVVRLRTAEPDRHVWVGYIDLLADGSIHVIQNARLETVAVVRKIVEWIAEQGPVRIVDNYGDDISEVGIEGLYD